MVLALLRSATVPEIAEESGLSEQSVRGYIRAMRKRRAVHVADWEHDKHGRRTLRAYALGQKPDKPKPLQRTRAEYARDYRTRRKMAQFLGIRA